MTNTSRELNQRIAWADVFRGILIVLVVIGHSTKKFNPYIYQFHMGAFFLISGYMARQERRSFLNTVYHRTMTILLPTFTALLLLECTATVLNQIGFYDIFFSEGLPYTGLVYTIKEFFLNGRIYAWWLGAGWFLVVLYVVSILHRLLYQLCGSNYGTVYAVFSVCLFWYGYVASQNQPHRWSWDLALIAQCYYALGAYVQHYKELNKNAQRKQRWYIYLGVGCCTLLFMGLVAEFFSLTMDFAVRNFNSPIIDLLLVINGSVLIYCASCLIEQVPGIRKLLRYLGRNTLPIVFFHFMCFKFGFYFLYLVGKAPLSMMASTTPHDEVALRYWCLFVLTGIGASLLIWKVLRSSKALRIALGQEKSCYAAWYERLSKNPYWDKLERKIGEWDLCALVRMRFPGLDRLSSYRWPIFGCVAVIVLVMLPTERPIGKTLLTCRIDQGVYEDGWCESYSVIRIRSGEEGIIHLEGWYNQPIQGNETITVFCAGEKAAEYVLESENIAFDIPCSIDEEVELEIQTNFSFEADPPDIRILAFILSALEGR